MEIPNFNQILDSLNSIPPEIWNQLIEVIISAIIVSPLALILKKWWKIHSEKLMLTMVIAGSIGAAAITYANTQVELRFYLIAIQSAFVFFTTQPVYYFFVKPLWIRLVIWINAKAEQIIELREARSAEVPAGGLPISKGNEQNTNN